MLTPLLALDFGGLVDAVVQNWVLYILALVGAAMLAALKKWWPKMAGPVLFGLAGLVIVLVGGFAITTMVRVNNFVSRNQPLDPSNLETEIRKWADTFGWATRRLDMAQAHFALELTIPPSSMRVVVMRPKELPNYLGLGFAMTLNKTQQAKFDTLSPDEARTFISGLKIELARGRVIYSNISVPLRRVNFDAYIPITAKLTEDEFLTTLNQLTMAKVLAAETIVSRLGN